MVRHHLPLARQLPFNNLSTLLRQSSGASVNEECLTAFQELKSGKKTKFIIYGMSADNSEIVVLDKSTEKDYDKFLETLPEAECRWAVYDFEFDSGEGLRNKIIFFAWCVFLFRAMFRALCWDRRLSGQVGKGGLLTHPSQGRRARAQASSQAMGAFYNTFPHDTDCGLFLLSLQSSRSPDNAKIKAKVGLSSFAFQNTPLEQTD